MIPSNQHSCKPLLKLILVTWIISKAICYVLWMGNREFPLVPVWDALLAVPLWVHFALFVSAMALMVLSILMPKKPLLWLILLFEILSCLLDQNRWQPWEYQFLFFIFCYAALPSSNMIRKGWQVILVSTYFFGGLFKLNPYFIHDTWQYLILIKWLHIIPHHEWLLRAGYLIPLIEMLAGMLLLFKISQRFAGLLLIAMHVFILLLLGPLGLNINGVVWPWNILLAILVYHLFIKRPQSVFKGNMQYRPAFVLVVLVWMLIPWLSMLGLWDKYLSSVLYGGGVEQLFICTENPEALQKSAPYRTGHFHTIPCADPVPVYKWGMYEMRTAPYPEDRIFRKIIRVWEKKYGDADFYLFKPGFKTDVKKWKKDNGGGWQ